jgi:glycosyltransferase involved in cell wall biosynthesis
VTRAPLSVVVIAGNEALTIRGCLESARFAEEILVVDSYSTDETAAIARSCGARVLQHEFEGFARQKNWAIGQATHEWVLALDADERVTPELAAEIQALLAGSPPHEAYQVRRLNFFLGRPMRFTGWGFDRVTRLFRRHVRFKDVEVHEAIDLPGPFPLLRGRLDHHSFRSFAQYLRKVDLYSDYGARRAHREGRRASIGTILLRPAARFLRLYVVRLGFLEGMHGLVLSLLGGFTVYLKYARLWEIQILAGRKEFPAERP